MLIPIRKVILFLLIIELFLLLMYFFPVDWSPGVANKFNLDNESNVPTWFSTVLLFAISLTSFGIYFLGSKFKINSSLKTFWLLLSAVLCFLSADEASMIHEGLGHFFNIPWFYIYAPLGATIFIVFVYLLFVVNRNRALAYWILGGLIIYLLGALGGELIYYYIFKGTYAVAEVVFEEGFEMFGEIIMLTGCLLELNRCLGIFNEQSFKT